MSDELGKELLVESTKAVAVEAYKDTFQPGCKAAGSIIALPFQAIDAALSRPKLWVAERQYNFEKTRDLIGEKLENTPPEKIVPPENYVAIPALQQISYCFDSDELRDMYANLLASSMHADKKWWVHPAFVDIIKQLTPDEAKLLRSFSASLKTHYPTIEVRINLGIGNEYQLICSNYSNVANDVCDCPENICSYLENLDRLKLIEIKKESALSDKSVYEDHKSDPKIQKLIENDLETGQSYDFKNGCFHLTSFGLSFLKICVLCE